jgi:preprotein translocase subunit SecG
MGVLYPFLIVVHVLICVALIIVVLLQSAKGEGLAGAFGGGGLSGAVFGGRGAATFLSKATTVLAICFMLSSIFLAVISLRVKAAAGPSGVIENLKTGPGQTMPPPPQSQVPGATPPSGDTGGGAGGNSLFNKPATQPAQPAQPAAQPQPTQPQKQGTTNK